MADKTATFELTELPADQQRGAILARIRDLEAQYLQLNLRIEAPGIGEVISPDDETNLATLQTSIQTLRDAEAALPSS